MADGAGKRPIRFPKAKHPAFNFLHKHIRTKLWPHWTNTERREFANLISKRIVFKTAIANIDTFIRRPPSTNILQKPYSIVKVTTGIAIWGLDHVTKCAGMPAFLEEHAQRLDVFPKIPAPGYGKPAGSPNRNIARTPDTFREDDNEPSEELSLGIPTLPKIG